MVRAVISPTAVLLLLLVESAAGHLLAAAPMWRNLWVSSMITKAAAGWSWLGMLVITRAKLGMVG